MFNQIVAETKHLIPLMQELNLKLVEHNFFSEIDAERDDSGLETTIINNDGVCDAVSTTGMIVTSTISLKDSNTFGDALAKVAKVLLPETTPLKSFCVWIKLRKNSVVFKARYMDDTTEANLSLIHI